MRLSAWIRAEKRAGRTHTFSSIARQIGTLPQTVECHAKGYKRPGDELRAKYERLTGGQVTFKDWAKTPVRKRPTREERKAA